jgi:S-adenosylmethionine:tRNA ribosyltransferase-isomerase
VLRIVAGPITATLLSDPFDGVATVGLDADVDIEDAIASHGTIPLPPYFHGTLNDPDRYQTMFARTVGSSAAPTAALHFTPSVIAGLERRGVDVAEVELNVGLDTFRPMSGVNVDDHTIHSERIAVTLEAADAVRRTRDHGGKVVAIGTTVVRTLESVGQRDGTIEPYEGDTDLFITPGFTPNVVDAVVTNFHAPRTTLLVLISSLIGDSWKDVYAHALASDYRFLSFGDAMFVEVSR